MTTGTNKLSYLEIDVSFETIADIAGATIDEAIDAKEILDQYLDGAMCEEFDEVDDANVKVACVGFDSIEAYDENDDLVNPDGEIAQRVARVVSGMRDKFELAIESAQQIKADIEHEKEMEKKHRDWK